MRIKSLFARGSLFGLLIVSFAVLPASGGKLTALDRYVAAPDTNYSFRLVATQPGADYTMFVLEMRSQAWLTTNEVSQPVWKHWLTIVRPEEVSSSTGLLFVTGGSLNRPAPKTVDGNLLHIAQSTKTVVAELRGVPNQPLDFVGETKGRSEDSLIAYTWDKFLRGGDEKWPARLPMTKSAVRALDTVTAFCASKDGGSLKVDSFVVAGASKRGWTTWTTAIVDKRVVAIIPIVIDLLNLEPSFKHHYMAYGFWAPAIKDYTQQHIMDWTDTKEYRALCEIEDPYEYRDRLTIPKFLINACGDQFFLPDSSQFYFNDLPGPTYLRYVPNADHSLKNSDAAQTLEACYQAVVTGAKLPRFDWKFAPDGSIRVKTEVKPTEVKLWQATNPKARDFRLDTIGPSWTSSAVLADESGAFVGKIETPTNGWSAFFIELTFPGGGSFPLKLTSGVRVLPDKLPFPPPVGRKPD